MIPRPGTSRKALTKKVFGSFWGALPYDTFTADDHAPRIVGGGPPAVVAARPKP
jgi:hypothetical protein